MPHWRWTAGSRRGAGGYPGHDVAKSGISNTMKLDKLLTVDAVSDARYAALDVRGISADSRHVKPRDLFVAVAGTKDDGLKFVAPAVTNGAVAVMAEGVPPAMLPDGVAFIRVGDVRRALA